MGANDSNSPNFKMFNSETGRNEVYPKNPSYLDRIKENLTVSEAQGNKLAQARQEYQSNAAKNIPSGDAKDASE